MCGGTIAPVNTAPPTRQELQNAQKALEATKTQANRSTVERDLIALQAYESGYTQTELAQILGITQQSISEALRRAKLANTGDHNG